MERILDFRHVDVFSERPYAGNGLIVVFGGVGEPSAQLLQVAQELRQFETIFVETPHSDERVEARIFTTEEELPFAGHPVIGAAAALHERLFPQDLDRSWTFRIAGRSITVTSTRTDRFYAARMNQGTATVVRTVEETRRSEFATALGLGEPDLLPLPMQTISTGLPYLIVPVAPDALGRARIAVDDLEARLSNVDAKFVYVLDPSVPEGRTWDNAGAVEDIATGSAAGPAVAYLDAHGRVNASVGVALRQGRFAGRPSVIAVERNPAGELLVGGPVAPVAVGRITIPT